jgi:hypothetical protein
MMRYTSPVAFLCYMTCNSDEPSRIYLSMYGYFADHNHGLWGIVYVAFAHRRTSQELYAYVHRGLVFECGRG